MAAFRREMSRTTAARQTKNKGWAHRLINSLTTGEQEINLARQALATYWDSQDANMLDTAINHFRHAGAYGRRQARALAFGFFLDAVGRYESCGHRQEDLKRTIRTGKDAQDLWKDRTNEGVYGVILYNLALAHQHLYDQSIANQGSGGSDIGAFDLAMVYFLQAIPVDDGDLHLLSRIQLGVLVMTRCTHENTTSELETCIWSWERALKDLNKPKSDKHINSKEKKRSTIISDKLIKEDRERQRANITYQLGVAYQLQYREDLDRDSRLQNLNTTIEYFEKAQLLFKAMKIPGFSSSALAKSLLLRWELTKEQSDMDRATELMKSEQTVEKVVGELKQKNMRASTATERGVNTHQFNIFVRTSC